MSYTSLYTEEQQAKIRERLKGVNYGPGLSDDNFEAEDLELIARHNTDGTTAYVLYNHTFDTGFQLSVEQVYALRDLVQQMDSKGKVEDEVS